MNNLCVQILVWLSFLKICASLNVNDVWHSHHYDPIYRQREEIVITNITADDSFKTNYVVKKWKSLQMESSCYFVGIMEKNIAIVSVELNSTKDGFITKASTIVELKEDVVDVVLLKYWNVSTQTSNAMILVATTRPELLWYRIDELVNTTLFWTWSLGDKIISHINVFQIEYEYHVLIVNKYVTHTTADLFLCELKDSPNFWLRQKLDLEDDALSSAILSVGPDNFIAIPQKKLNLVLIYKLTDGRFLPYKNLSSRGVDDVVAFKIGHNPFLAMNGLNAGIYKVTKKDLIRESILESHLDGVNYWLPMPLTVYGDDTILIAQRSLDHGLHKSFVIEIITYNGDKFEEHDDIPCFYFGEDSLGLSCLPDEETGMKGSASIFLDGVLGLVVPRTRRASELFVIGVDLRKMPNPLIEQIDSFTEKKKYLDALITEQERRYNKLLTTSGDSFDTVTLKTQLDQIDEDIRAVKANGDTSGTATHFDTVVFNGIVIIQSDAIFDELQIKNIDGESANATLEDIVLKHNISELVSFKIFDQLETEDLIVDNVNKINSSNLLFNSGNVSIAGNLFLVKPLTIFENVTTSEVNGLPFEDEVLDVETPITDLVFENLKILGNATMKKLNSRDVSKTNRKDLNFEKLELENLTVPMNIEVGNVNGEDFNAFLGELCLKNLRNVVPGTIKVQGDITVEKNAEIDYLNDLQFPLEYVFVDNNFPNITGTKRFSRKISASEIQCEETVDGIDTDRIITLSTDQNVSATTTFKNLKITESLNVDGQIVGEHASKFLPNPTLRESNSIKAKVNFRNLEVQGAIVLSENFNGRNFESILNDIIYVNESNPVIVAIKQFPEALTVRKQLLINSNSVNNIDLDSVVTRNTDQVLNISTINGVVTFSNVDSGGLYDSVDVRKLDEELVKLDGEQYISSTLIFEDEIDVNKLAVVGNVSFLGVKFNNTKKLLDPLAIENIRVDSNFYGSIDGFDLKEFESKTLSFVKNQIVEARFAMKKTFARDVLLLEMNNVDPYSYTYEGNQHKLKSNLVEGKLSVTNLHTNDSLEVDKINNRTAAGLGGSLWKHDLRKYNLTNLTFSDDVYFDNLKIEKLSGVNFDKYVANIVFKNETDLKVSGRKVFLEGYTVQTFIETAKLNHILLSNVLTKYSPQEIVGPVTIQGNVTAGNITVIENINGIPVTTITNTYKPLDGQAEIKGDILFNRLAHIRNLDIEGYVDDKLAQDVMDGIVYTDDDIRLEGQTVFEDSVNIEKNIRVTGKINNIDLPALVSDMVMVTKDATILNPVRFTESGVVEKGILLHDELKTQSLNDFKPENWIDQAIFIDRGHLKGTYMFQDVRVVDTLRTKYINNINTQTLIPLRNQQNITKLTFNEVSLFRDVAVGNSTNFCNLHDEFMNTFLIDKDQDIDSYVEFQGNVFIEGDVELLGALNDVETNRIITTNSDQELSAIYNFKSKTNIEKNLTVEGLVNGIDIAGWRETSIRTKTHSPQNIGSNWTIGQDLIFEEDCLGRGVVNTIDFRKFSQEIGDRVNYKYQLEKAFIDDYTNICKDLTFMYDKLKTQIYKFSYFENIDELNFQNKIDFVFDYMFQNNSHLLVNERKNCESYLFLYDRGFRYAKTIHFGQIAQIIVVHYNDLMYLVIRNQPFYSACKVQGTNLWQVVDNDFVRLATLEDQELLQESSVPGTFYGISGYIVTEFKILPELDSTLRKYRKWEVKEENMAFVPGGFATGLALTTGKKLIRLHRDPVNDDYNYDTENIVRGDYTEEFNTYFPGRKNSEDFVVMKVGIKSTKRSLLAVASHEETSVRGSLDFIKIYEDLITAKVFHKVPTYKPSSLVSLEFNNGETLLAFMEDETVLQVYEYKGVGGFKQKLSAKVEGTKLFVMSARFDKVIGVVNNNKIIFIKAVMLGNQIAGNLQCSRLEV